MDPSTLLHTFLDYVLHLDTHLAQFTQAYGAQVYGLLFGIIFCETGLVVTPFLPGDSLLFAAGALAATPGGGMNIWLLWGLLWVAAVVGDNVNYWLGVTIGPRVFASSHGRIFNRAHLDRTQGFYDRYGAKTLVIARFVPIVRTFAPFVAGIGRMPYPRFLAISVAGGGLWMTTFLWAGYFFGNLEVVRHNFTLVIFAVIGVSLLPGLVEWLKHRRAAQAPTAL